MLHLSAFAPADQVDAICDALAAVDGAEHVVAGASTREGLVSVSADVDGTYADEVIAILGRFDLRSDDVRLWRVPSITPLDWRQPARSAGRNGHVWAEVVDRAVQNSQLATAYALYMIAAGVIAGVGVLTGSSILIVGAMAISPDLLPISAGAIGLVERRWDLAARAGRALAIGLALGVAASWASTLLLRIGNRIPDDLVLADSVLGPSLTQLGPGSVLVAVAAGVAGMVAFERASGAAVGVAISVTTVPAAAYVGAAIALGRNEPMWGAMVVLVTNVALIVVASTATLEVQRRRRRSVAA